MKTTKDNHRKKTISTKNRRIAAVLAFILLFQTIFSGVEVHAEPADSASESGASSPVSVLSGTTNTGSAATQQDTITPWPSDHYTLTIDKSGAWGGHAQYSVTITNTSDATLEDIALALPWQDAEVDGIWGATASNHQGTIYILPLEWCENLAPGANFSFGIILKGDDDKLDPPEKHALITSEQVTAIQDGIMQPPSWEELQTPEPENTSGPTTSPLPTPTHTTEVECTPEPINTPDPTTAPTAEPTSTPKPTPTTEPTPAPTPSPAPTAEPTPVPTPGPTPTPEPTPSPAPTTAPYLTTEITSTEPATYGYTTPPSIQIQISNLGQGTSLPFTLAIPSQNTPFTILSPDQTILAGGEHTTITIQLATGLNAGIYTDTLTLHVPGQPDTAIPLLQQIHKLPVLEPAGIHIVSITTDSITLSEISGYEYAIGWQPDQTGIYQDSPVFTGLQPDTDYTLFMRKKEDANHTAGQITTAQVRTNALPAPEPTPIPEPTSTPIPTLAPTAEPTGEPSPSPAPTAQATALPTPPPGPEPWEDLHVDGALTLTEDTTCRNLYMNGTRLDTNGYKLTVTGNVIHQSGTIYANIEQVPLIVKGNYKQDSGRLNILYGAHVQIDGNYTMNGNAECRMRYDSGCLLDIRGNWTINTEEWNIFETGTIRLGGNLTQTKGSHEESLKLSKGMNLVLDGTQSQTVQTVHEDTTYLANINLQQAENVQFNQPVCAYSLDGLSRIHNPEKLQLSVDNLCLTQDETIHNNLESLRGEINTNGYKLTAEQNVHIFGGRLEVFNSTLRINGNLTQQKGTLDIQYGARVSISGNYQLTGSGRCHLRYDNDNQLHIRGSWIISTTQENYLENGTIRLGGNLTQTSESGAQSLNMYKGMNLILDGTAPQTIQTAHEETSYLANVDVTQADAVTITEELYARTIQGLSRIANTDELMLHVSMITPDRDETLSCDLILDGGSLRLYEHTLTINGNLETWNADITIDNGGTLTVQDSITHDRGTLHLYEGTINTGGSYYLDDTYFETDHPDSIINIQKNLTLAGNDTRYIYFWQGEMYLGGNLTQKNPEQGSLIMNRLFHLWLQGNTTQNIWIADETGHSLGNLYLYRAKEVLFHQPVHAWHIDDISVLSPEQPVKLYAESSIGVRSEKPVQPQITLCQGGMQAYHGMATFLNNLTIQKGYIEGDIHCKKNLYAAKGSINPKEIHVEGNLILAGTASIKMKEKARLQVDGNFTYKSTAVSTLESGTCVFGGNIRINKPGTAKTLLEQSDACSVYLKGTDIQNIYLGDEALWEIRRLHLETSAGVIIHDPLRVRHLTGWDKILGTLTLGECDVQLKQDEILYGTLSLNNTVLEPLGHTLEIQGNIQAMDSTIHVQASEIIIGGDLTLDGFSLLQMIHMDDKVTVYGDYITRSEAYHYTNFNNGTLKLYGNFHQSGSKYSFAPKEKHKTYFYDIEGQEKVHEVYFTDALESGFNNSDYANGCKLHHIAEPKNALEAAEIFTIGFAESLNIVEHVVDALLELGEMVEQDAELLRTDPGAFGASMFLKAGVTSMENMNCVIQGINTFLLVKDTIQYYTGSNASLAEKITSAGEVTGTLVITLIALSIDLVNLDKEGVATLMEGIKTGNLSAATLARACGDTRQMAKAAQTFFEKEAAEQIADMSVSQARYLLKTGEQVQKAAGGTIRLGKTEILKLLDNFADDIAADIAAETLAAQIGKTKIMEAIEAVLDKTTFEAIKDTIEGRGLEPAELEKLNQVIRRYSLQKGEKMNVSQIRGLLKDGRWLTEEADDVVKELIAEKNKLKDLLRFADEFEDAGILSKVKEKKNALTGKYKDKSSNFGYCEVNVNGLERHDYYSHSKIHSFEDIATTDFSDNFKDISRKYSSDEALFKPYKVNPYNVIDGDGAWLRNVDTEHKLLEHIARDLQNNMDAKGKIKLYTDRKPCVSCEHAISEFCKMYPEIELTVIYNGK